VHSAYEAGLWAFTQLLLCAYNVENNREDNDAYDAQGSGPF